MHDLRHAIRTLARRPGAALVVVLTLALSLGANTAIFAVADAVLLRPLPVDEPERLVAFEEAFSYPDYLDMRDRQEVFAGVVAYADAPAALDDGSRTERVTAQIVTGNYFEVLGVEPEVGRALSPDDDREPGASAVVVISHDAWRSRFGGAPGVVGSAVRINGRPFTIVGVAPRGFRGTEVGGATDLWVPLAMHEWAIPGYEFASKREERAFGAFARLGDGVTVERARANVESIVAALALEHPATNAGTKATVVPIAAAKSPLRESLGPVLTTLAAVAAFVLFVACANVANLLLAGAVSRRREISIRLALGASRWRVARQLLAESLVLAALGAAAGLLFVLWTADALLRLLQPPGASFPLAVDGRVLAFMALAMAATVTLFGLAPALEAARPDLVPSLKREAATAAPSRSRLRDAFVVVQVALSVVVLVGAALFARSLGELRAVDPGLSTSNVLTFRVAPGLVGYDGERAAGAIRRVQERLVALPGVESASASQLLQLGFGDIRRPIVRAGEPADDDPRRSVGYNVVGAGYFRTLGIPVLAGREFDDRDSADGPRAVVVNESLARALWPGESAVGKRVQLPLAEPGPELEVVGVARDSKYQSLVEAPKLFFYLPLEQNRRASVTFLVRTRGNPAALSGLVRRELREVDPNLPAFAVQTLDEYVDRHLQHSRALAALTSACGVFALLLAAVGLYGVLSFAVGRRSREIGIRMALGASRRDVVRMVVGSGMAAVGAGLAVGVAAAYGLARLVSGMLFGVGAADPSAYAGAAAVMAAVALAACLVPARRAASVDPVEAIRSE